MYNYIVVLAVSLPRVYSTRLICRGTLFLNFVYLLKRQHQTLVIFFTKLLTFPLNPAR